VNQDAIWVEDFVGPSNYVLDGLKCGPGAYPQGKGQFWDGLPVKCIRLQQTTQHQGAANLSVRESVSWRKRGFRMDSPATEVTSTGQCSLFVF